ncbi:MAG: murein biosynthesis integral membrane protein MurJ [Candidatus Pacebacteria bacterium]|nr:murein biosynthesis integral membrane protein MurJ [Candidatus Paceibacterota bacterium]
MFFKLPKLLVFNTNKWLERQQTSILSAAAIITVANVVSSLAGLLRERFLIASFFSSVAGQQAYEAFQVAFQIPDMLFQLIVLGALSAAFIPVFTALKKKDQTKAFQVSAVVMNVLLLIFLLVSVGVFLIAQPLTAWRTGAEFATEQIQITANLTRIMLIAQFFFAISNFLTGILQSYQRFIMPAIAPVLYNLGIILGVWLFAGSLGIYAAGLGVIIGAFLHMAAQLPLAWKLGFRFHLSFNWRLPGVREMFRLIPPRVLTLAVTELQNLALGFLATSIGNLSFVIIRLGLRLMTIPIRLFGVPISQASLPFFAAESADFNQQKFKELVLQSLHQISFLALPASVLLLILRVPIVRLVFGTHNFAWSHTIITGRVVALISISIAAQAMVQLLIRTFHALKDTKTPFMITVVSVSVYLVAGWLLVNFTDYGVLGLAATTSLVAFVELALFMIFLDQKIQAFISKAFFLPQLKMISASFLMAVFLYLPFRIFDELVFDTSRTVELIALTITTGTIGMLVYLYFAALFEIRELNYLITMLQKFGRWRKPLVKAEEVLVETSVEGDEV